jgi:hypothetical protein
MNQPIQDSIDIRDTAEDVSPQSRHAWEIWKKLTDFSEFLWDAYEKDFLTLAASLARDFQGSSEPPPKG